MCLKMILFDLDGTLLPMDQDAFIKKYFGLLAAKMAPHGYEAAALLDAIQVGTAAMVKNDGSRSNEAAFWDSFTARFGESSKADIPLFEEFYQNEFAGAKAACGCNPAAAETVAKLNEQGFRVALATNPLFPMIATENRIRWAGLAPEDFELYTTYEHFSYCKPNPAYYQEILDKQGLTADEVIMIGNDAREDTAAAQIGIPVFLVTDCLLNQHGLDISGFPQGNWDDCVKYIDEIISSKAAN